MTNWSKIVTALKSENGKSLIENFSYLTILQFAGYFFPLITLPYLARVIGVDKFGDIALALAIVGYFQTISDWGFNFTATRDVARHRTEKSKVAEIFSNVFWSRILLMFICFLLLIALVLLIPMFYRIQELLFVTFIMILGQILFPEWFFQAIEKMKYITILNIFSKVISTIAVFIFIKEKSDYWLQPTFISIGYIFSGLIAMYYTVNYLKVPLLKPNWRLMVKMIKSSYSVFINNLMPNLYNSFSVILLGFFCGSISNGKLDAGNKFIGVSLQFLSVTTRVFFPYLSRNIGQHRLYAKGVIVVSLIVSAVLFLLAPFLINLFFSKDFYNSISVLRILSISIPFVALYNIYGINYLIIEGFERKIRNITTLCSLIGFFIAIPFIYFWGYIGAAITITLIRVLLGITSMLNAIFLKKNCVVFV